MRMARARSTITLVIIIVFAGSLAGLVYGTANMIIVNPYLEAAIEIENNALFATGTVSDTPEFRAEYQEYREWQRGGHILAGIVLGASIGSLFGVVFASSRTSLLGRGNITKALFLAGIMWFSLYIVPFLKYPPTPPAVGDPETIGIRTIVFLVLVAASGLGALCAGKTVLHLVRRRGFTPHVGLGIGVALYAGIVLALFVALPANNDPIPEAVSGMIDGFRTASAVASALFWVSIAVFLGLFWSRVESVLASKA